MSDNKSLGFIETFGLAACVAAADAAVKTANVKLLGFEYAKGGGMCTVKVEGNVGACKAAVAAGKKAADLVNGSLSGTKSVLLKARPADGMRELLVDNRETVGGEIALAEGYRPKGDTKKPVLVKNWRPKTEPKAEDQTEKTPEPPVVEEPAEEPVVDTKTEEPEPEAPEAETPEAKEEEPEESELEPETEAETPETKEEEPEKPELEPETEAETPEVKEEEAKEPEAETEIPEVKEENAEESAAEEPSEKKTGTSKGKTSTGKRNSRSRRKKNTDKTDK